MMTETQDEAIRALHDLKQGYLLVEDYIVLKMRPSVVATHYKCCSSCLTLLHTQCTL